MSTLRISDAPLLPDVDGTEKIPTGGRGDYAISVDQIKDHIFQDVGKELVGLGNVDNTSDLDKPVSTAQQAALNLKADKTYVDNNLDLKADKTNVYTRSETTLALSNKADLVNGVVPENQIPSSFNDVLEFTTPNLPIVGESGKIYVTTDNNKTWRWSGNQYVEISGWNPDSVSKKLTVPTYYTKEAGVNSVTGVTDGAYFNVRSTDDDTMLVEYQNIGGSAVATGKSYPSSAAVQQVIDDVAVVSNKQIKHNKAFPSVLDHADVVGNGAVSDSIALQEYFRDADDNRKSSIFFPLRNHNYLLNAPLIAQEPLMIYGDAGATYNRGIGKDGYITIGASADYAFNLGNERTYSATEQNVDTKKSRNPSDNWSVKNISIKPDVGVSSAVKTGIKHTTSNNGPDRGLLLREVSGTRLKHVLHITDQGQDTQLATCVVENCCLSNNDIAVFAEGLVFGLRFVGNQAEQNWRGAIHGTFTGGVTIEDNMLEGQPDPIKLTIPSAGAKFQASIKRNYFEVNRGEALIEVASSSDDNVLETGPNFFSRVGTTFPKHYLLLKGRLDAPRRPSSAFTVINRDAYPVSLYETATIKIDSDIFSKVNFFRQAEGYNPEGHGGRVFTSKFSSFTTRSTARSGAVYGGSFPSEVTELGNIRYSNITTSPTSRVVSLAANTGDVLALNVLLKLSPDAEGAVTITVRSGDGVDYVTAMAFTVGNTFLGNHGGVIMLTAVVKSLTDVSSMTIGLTSGLTRGSGKFYGASIENFGQHVVGEVKDIYPSIPEVTYSTNTVQVTYDPPTIDAGGTTTRDVALAGVAVGSVVHAAFSLYDPNIEISAAVSASATVTVKFKNTGVTPINLGEGILTVKSL